VIDQELPSSVLPVLYENDHKWKTKLEEPLQPNQVMMLLTLGDVKHNILSYLNAHPNIQIIELSTKHIKKREKGLGLKVKVKLKENMTHSLQKSRNQF